MARLPLPSTPDFIEEVNHGLVVKHASLDEQLLEPGSRLFCWFCYRGMWVLWDNADPSLTTLRCVGPRACHTYYAAWTEVNFQRLSPRAEQRVRCACGQAYWKVKADQVKCVACGEVKEFNLPLKGLTALLKPELRDHFREEGFLGKVGETPASGPTWHKTKNPNPWLPRVDLPKPELRRRLRKYRRLEEQKLDQGRDPVVDYRRCRDVW